ncbi:MAG: glycosyltransferase family 4 protein, partial [Chitinophagaceae bacterium]|nr:glycosyltransferase family 4 protein [Chitinophagaceae bacterium]
MRILFVHTRYLQSAGGEDSTLEAESGLLRMKGHEVDILLFDNADTVKGFTGKLNAGISAIYNRRSARILGRAIERFKPDIIHVHNFFFTGSPSIFFEAKRYKVPIVATIQNYRLICANALLLRNHKVCELCVKQSFPWHGVKYKCYHDSAIQSAVVGSTAAIHKWIGTWKNKVDMFLAPAYFIRSKLIASSFNVSADRIIVKHNFIADPGFSDGASRQSFYLFVGRLSEEKGVETLLKAWLLTTNKQLLIVGEGPEKDKLASTYGHLPEINFAGKKNHAEVLQLMKQCRALIFPSIWYEGLPLTIIEALATGTPVISSDLGAMQEMISHQHNGLLF